MFMLTETSGFVIWFVHLVADTNDALNPLRKLFIICSHLLVIRNSIFYPLVIILILIPTVIISLFVLLLCSFHVFLVTK